MKYRTTCPHCASVFRVGTDQLDAAQGWTQCGVCGAAFDARAGLLMEDGSPLPTAPEPAATFAPEIVVTPAPAPADTPAPAAAEEPAAPGPGDAPPAAERPVGIARREAERDLSSIIIIDPDMPVPDDFGPLPEIPAAAASGMPPMYPPPDSYPPDAAVSALATAGEYALPPSAELPGWHAAPAPRRSRSWAWGSASALLLVMLLAQGAYFLRDTLASQLPQSRPGLERMCTLLGCTLSLPKNLARLQIVGSDLETEADGRLRLSLTLGNRDNHAQAWPVLVLTLTDQRNIPLARRSFAPSEYLADPARIAAGVPPRSEQPLSLPLTVHDLKPMGFDLQLVY